MRLIRDEHGRPMNIGLYDLIKYVDLVRTNTKPELKRILVGICECGGEIERGPIGGMSQNVFCKACGQKYNVTPFGVERL